MKNTFLFKDFPNRTNFKTFVNERLFNAKVKRFVSYDKTGIIITCKMKDAKTMGFGIRYGYIMDIDFDKREYTIALNTKDLKYILNEINFFRKFPEDAKKQNKTVI